MTLPATSTSSQDEALDASGAPVAADPGRRSPAGLRSAGERSTLEGRRLGAAELSRHRPSGEGRRGDHHRRRVLLVEAAVLAVVVAFAAYEAPGFASSITDGFSRLTNPDLWALAAAAALEALSLVALAAVPRWLLRRSDVSLSWHDAVTLTLASNGIAVLLPAGSVASTVWMAHQYTRRGARTAVAAWVVLAAGFASSVTIITLGLVGAVVAEPAQRGLVVTLLLMFLAGAAGFVWLVHRAERLDPGSPAAATTRAGRLYRRLADLLGDSAGQRAGWGTGGAVIGASTVNWLADAAVLAATFHLLRLPIPWTAVLLAYAAGQIAGALVPLPGGVGVVEGGTIGVLLALGVKPGTAIAVVSVYRLIGYWGPMLASVPAYGWVRRHLPAESDVEAGQPGAGSSDPASGLAGVAPR